MIALHGLVIAQLMGTTVIRAWGPRLVWILLGLNLISVGNLLPRTHPNLLIGIRTRRTIASSAMWRQVHRTTGWATVIFGIVMVLGALLLNGPSIVQAASVAVIGGSLVVLNSCRRNASLE